MDINYLKKVTSIKTHKGRRSIIINVIIEFVISWTSVCAFILTYVL